MQQQRWNKDKVRQSCENTNGSWSRSKSEKTHSQQFSTLQSLPASSSSKHKHRKRTNSFHLPSQLAGSPTDPPPPPVPPHGVRVLPDQRAACGHQDASRIVAQRTPGASSSSVGHRGEPSDQPSGYSNPQYGHRGFHADQPSRRKEDGLTAGKSQRVHVDHIHPEVGLEVKHKGRTGQEKNETLRRKSSKRGRRGEVEVHRHLDSRTPPPQFRQGSIVMSPSLDANCQLLANQQTQYAQISFRDSSPSLLPPHGSLARKSHQTKGSQLNIDNFRGSQRSMMRSSQLDLRSREMSESIRRSQPNLDRGRTSPASNMDPRGRSSPCSSSRTDVSHKNPAKFRRNGSQPCLRLPHQPFQRQSSASDILSNPRLRQNSMDGLQAGTVRFLPKSKSFSEECAEESSTALEVVRNKRAKQLLAEKTIKIPPRVGHSRSDLRFNEPRAFSDASPLQPPSQPLHNLPPPPPINSSGHTPEPAGPGLPHGIPVHVLSPDSSVPPPPSPPCTCGKVLGDMGPPPPPDHWDSQSIDSHVTAESKGTIESRRSQGYVSMTSASTYLIDATGADPVIVPADVYHFPGKQAGYQGGGGGGGGFQGVYPYPAEDRSQDGDLVYRPPGDGVYRPPPPGEPRTGHCNHLNESCECFRENFSLSRKGLSRMSNGNCSTNGFLKDLETDSSERGVTFRVGKFIGQVTIESVKFRRQHWLFLFACLLVFVIILSVYLPIVTRGPDLQDAAYRIRVVRQLLREVPLVDGHNDLAWNIRKFVHNKLGNVNFSSNLAEVKPWSTSKWSHTDIPRLTAGGLGAQLWVAYAPCGSQHKDAVQITLEQIDLIKRFIEQYSEHLEFVTTSQELISAHQRGKIASLISVESGHSIGTSLGVLRMYQRLGVRSLALTHNCNNPWADSSLVDRPGGKPVHNGLTEFGKTVIAEMNRLGIIVDLSHSSIQTSDETIEKSEAPVIYSHSSAQALCNSSRNVPDHLIKKVAAKGGLVMINFFSYFITCSNISSITDVIDHINHVREVGGVDHVGIGASYDGINAVPTGLEDVSKYVELISALYASGKWKIDELKKLVGLNFLRVFREVEKVGDRLERSEVGEQLIPGSDIKDSLECRTINKRNANAIAC